MKILHICAEFFPLLKTGGLADVMGALPAAQIKAGADVRLLIPAYPALQEGFSYTTHVVNLNTFAGFVTLRYGTYNNVGIYLIDAPHLYQRTGGPYQDAHKQDHEDNYLRFAILGWIASEISCGIDDNWQPDILHAHDWHAGLACAYLIARGRPIPSVFTIHNLAYRGSFPRALFHKIGLANSFFSINGLEFYGEMSYLKAGVYYADQVTTVSPTYAKEITYSEYGYGLEGLLKTRYEQGCLHGILNGIDTTVWNPKNDKILSYPYDTKNIQTKLRNKAKLQANLSLTVDNKKLIFGIISRLTEQKGLDLVLAILPALIHRGGQFVLLGNGDPQLENCFKEISKLYPHSISVNICYNESLSHQIIAGADIIMVPSRFEPCGLTQLYGLAYGTLPLVRHTGGLADTVIDCTSKNLTKRIATGFTFDMATSDALYSTVQRAFTLWEKANIWEQVQHNAMTLDFGWHISANAYLSIYQQLLSSD